MEDSSKFGESLTEEGRARLLIEAVTDYAIYMLDPQGHVTSWNPGAERFKGYTAQEIIGQHFSRFYTPEDQAAGVPARNLARAANEGKYEEEGWRVRKDGSRFWATIVIDPIRDPGGRLVGFAKITRDLTERRETQQALEEAREALFQSQKLDAIGQLTGGVAHDFNNLLMVILSSLELLRRRIGDDPKTLGILDNAVRGAKRGAALTQRMLSFARRQDLKPTVVDVVDLVNGVADLLRRSLGPAVALEVAPRGEPQLVLVDANQMELALLNLAVNARDAMPAGGVVRIEVTRVEVPGPASGARLVPGSYVRVAVSDRGVGMDERTLARAAEPFFTTKGLGKGTGLGLSMVEGLASQSGGRFMLKSRPGEGTTAEIWLPVATTPKAAPAAAGARAALRSTREPLNVLAVDDDHLVLTNTVALLEELGHSVQAVGSAHEALAVLHTGAPGLQLLVTDHAMPAMTGAALVELARRQAPGLATVLATGYAELDAELPPEVIKLAKPFDLQELDRAIDAAMRRVQP